MRLLVTIVMLMTGMTVLASDTLTVQSINDPKLTACPACGAPVFRVIQAPGLGHSQTDLHYRAKRAGFSCLKKVQKGEYEKVF